MRLISSASVAAAVVAAVSMAAVPVGAAEPSAASPPPLLWGACPVERNVEADPRIQCAELRVPVDHRAPDGPQLTVAVSRIATARPDLRRGVLLTNPGGPGGPGLVGLPTRLAAGLPADVRDRYDIVGFDPRGVGHSTPVTCGLPADTPSDLAVPFPDPSGSIQRNVDFARTTAAACDASSGALLPFITTANTARDMDRLRAALDEPRISYLGYSYGTYLGQVYATLFPERTDRIVLDSSVDPARVWDRTWPLWGMAGEVRMPDFTAWAAAHDDVYHLGATPGAVRSTYDRLVTTLDRTPLVPSGRGQTLTGNLLRLITFQSLYSDTRFPPLAQLWQRVVGLLDAGVPAPAVPDPRVAALGVDEPPPAAPEPGTPADNASAALYAVTCDDADWRPTPADHARAVAIDRFVHPLTGGMPANIWPCAFWAHRPVEPPVRISATGPRNILLLQNRRDPATPWVSGLGARRALGRRAVMVSVDAGGHGVYPHFTGGPCADDIATAFLTEGDLPPADVSCAGSRPDDVIPPTAIVPAAPPGPAPVSLPLTPFPAPAG